MQYSKKSITRSGLALFAEANANSKAVVVDKIIISENKIDENIDLSTIKISDFTHSRAFDISNLSQLENAFTAQGIIDNKALTTSFSIYLIGVTAHLSGSDTSKLIAVISGNDPFVLPPETDTIIQFVPRISIAYSNTPNINITVDNAIYVTKPELDNTLKKYVEISVFETNLSHKADISKTVNLIGDQTISGTKTFETAPINKTNGKKFITSDELPKLPPNIAETDKLTNFSLGLQKNGKDVATVDQLNGVGSTKWLVLFQDKTQQFNIIKYQIKQNIIYLSAFWIGKTSAPKNIALPKDIAQRLDKEMFLAATTDDSGTPAVYIPMIAIGGSVQNPGLFILNDKGEVNIRNLDNTNGGCVCFTSMPLT